MATETDAAETFKMHAPLIGNRADCDGEKRKERSCVNGSWGGGRGTQLPRDQPGPAGRPERMEQEWGCLIR